MIELLTLFSADSNVLKKTVEQMDDNYLFLLVQLKFKNLCSEEHKQFVQKLLTCTCKVKINEKIDLQRNHFA